jgi:hypothetical protein
MFEQQIAQGIFQRSTEKTFLDKVLARQDVDQIKEIIKKEKLTRSELLELLYMLTANEAKLVNYNEWDRYIILKFFVWIREFIKVAELLFDIQDDYNLKEKLGTLKTTPRFKQLLDNNIRLCEHNAKFLIDLYLNIARTTLSLQATGFLESLHTKFEFSYPQAQVQQPEMKTSFFGLKKG